MGAKRNLDDFFFRCRSQSMGPEKPIESAMAGSGGLMREAARRGRRTASRRERSGVFVVLRDGECWRCLLWGVRLEVMW